MSIFLTNNFFAKIRSFWQKIDLVGKNFNLFDQKFLSFWLNLNFNLFQKFRSFWQKFQSFCKHFDLFGQNFDLFDKNFDLFDKNFDLARPKI